MVLAIVVPAVAKLSKEDSQRIIVPVYPLNVKVVLLTPVHTVKPPAIVPPTDAGETVTVVITEFATAQLPFCITALNCVVAVKASEV